MKPLFALTFWHERSLTDVPKGADMPKNQATDRCYRIDKKLQRAGNFSGPTNKSLQHFSFSGANDRQHSPLIPVRQEKVITDTSTKYVCENCLPLNLVGLASSKTLLRVLADLQHCSWWPKLQRYRCPEILTSFPSINLSWGWRWSVVKHIQESSTELSKKYFQYRCREFFTVAVLLCPDFLSNFHDLIRI